eukprot:Stramenopile-MAST_4_protein_4260
MAPPQITAEGAAYSPPGARGKKRVDASEHKAGSTDGKDGALTTTDERLLCTYDTHVFDLTEFQDLHPGGKTIIELNKGRDITHLYDSYHWGQRLTQRAKNPKYRIKEVDAKVECVPEALSADTHTDQSIIRLQKHLIKLGYSSKNLKIPWYGVLYFALGLSLYAFCGYQWFIHPTTLGKCVYGALFGQLAFYVCGFLQHEGCHTALSNHMWINKVGAYLLMPWGHPGVWLYKHVIQHHPNTNTTMDGDIQFEGPILRHHKANPLTALHKIQSYTINFLSMFVSLSHPMNFDIWGQYPLTTAMYLSSFLAVFGTQMYLTGSFLLGFLPIASFGLVFVFVTQLSHIQEECIDQTKVLTKPPNFTKHQISACFDYNHNSFLISAFSIFLNFQTYHHLVPGISHFHFLFNKQLVAHIDQYLADNNEKVNVHQFVDVVKGYFGYLAKLQSDD